MVLYTQGRRPVLRMGEGCLCSYNGACESPASSIGSVHGPVWVVQRVHAQRPWQQQHECNNAYTCAVRRLAPQLWIRPSTAPTLPTTPRTWRRPACATRPALVPPGRRNRSSSTWCGVVVKSCAAACRPFTCPATLLTAERPELPPSPRPLPLPSIPAHLCVCRVPICLHPFALAPRNPKPLPHPCSRAQLRATTCRSTT